MNNQQISKIVSFFRLNFQFHPPYQMILDGNFIKLLVEKELDFSKRLEHILSGKAILRVTSCILRELELLGQSFTIVLNQAKTYKLISCKHPFQYSVDRCILDQIAQNNQRQYFVCSQDLELRRSLRDFANVPIVYFGPDQRVTMEDIHKKTLKELQNQTKNKYLPQPEEQKEVKELQKQKAIEQRKQKIRELSSQQGIQIKTKIAKGPNPLSVKKKTVKMPEVSTEPKRKRIRKRNKKHGNVQSMGGRC